MKCILIWSLTFCCAPEILALHCASPDGLSVEDVRKVVGKCMKKSTTEPDNDYQEYENIDRNDIDGRFRRRNETLDPSGTLGYINLRYPSQSIGNYNNIPRTYDGRNQGPYQPSFSDNNNSGNNANFQGANNDRQNSSTDSNLMHDDNRSCVLQCFFRELKMTNDGGFPEKQKTLHVLTKELRDRELKDFYTDSIQECFHMIDNYADLKLHRNNCLYSKALIACLFERAKANCADWDRSSVMF